MNLLNKMTKEQAIVESICKMDIDSLKALLADDRMYNGKCDKSFLMLEMTLAFHDFKKAGNTELIAYAGQCNKCESNKGKKGYSFIGNKTGHNLSFLFRLDEENNVVDLISCGTFKTNSGKLVDENLTLTLSSEAPF